MRTFILFASLLSSLVACVDTDDHASESTLSTTAVPPPGPAKQAWPRIAEVSWTWHGCGPELNPLPFSLVVHVDVLSPDATYQIKGDAIGCDPFHGNDQLAICTASPEAIVRVLTVEVGDSQGIDTRSIGLNDCVDGKQEFLP